MENKKQLFRIGGIIGFVMAGLYTLMFLIFILILAFTPVSTQVYTDDSYRQHHSYTNWFDYEYSYDYYYDDDVLYQEDIFIIIFVLGIIAIMTIPVYIGSYKFLKYSRMDEDELKAKSAGAIGWSIALLILSFIPGLLGLIACFANTSSKELETGFAKDLKDLNKLKEEGLITEAEYEKKKKKILDI